MNYLNKTMSVAMGGSDSKEFSRRWDETFGAKCGTEFGDGTVCVLPKGHEGPHSGSME